MPTPAARLATLRAIAAMKAEALDQLQAVIAQLNAVADSLADALMQTEREAASLTHPHAPGTETP